MAEADVVGLAAAEVGLGEADTEVGAMIEEGMIGVLLEVGTVVATEVGREGTHRTRCCRGETVICTGNATFSDLVKKGGSRQQAHLHGSVSLLNNRLLS